MFRKAQAAMEFLMTYGWAILVVLVVIGALAYFGVLSPATLLPEKCSFPVSVNCVDHSVESDKITIILQNGAGRDMLISRMVISSDALGLGGGGERCEMTTVTTLRNSQSGTFILNDPIDGTGAAGVDQCLFIDTGRDKNRYNITVEYSWLDSPTLSHKLIGELLAKAP